MVRVIEIGDLHFITSPYNFSSCISQEKRYAENVWESRMRFLVPLPLQGGGGHFYHIIFHTCTKHKKIHTIYWDKSTA
jgi:hypothetical protein